MGRAGWPPYSDRAVFQERGGRVPILCELTNFMSAGATHMVASPNQSYAQRLHNGKDQILAWQSDYSIAKDEEIATSSS